MDPPMLDPSVTPSSVHLPLLHRNHSPERPSSSSFSGRARTLDAARYLQRAASGSRFMREQSVAVRDSATEQLEERQSDWAYSRPVVVLDLVWNLAFVCVSLAVLCLSRHEHTLTPLRLWVVGYTLQCGVHMACVWTEYRRRRRRSGRRIIGNERRQNVVQQAQGVAEENVSEMDDMEGSEVVGSPAGSFAKQLESVNTMFSFLWWIVGFWCILSAMDDGFHDAPMLSWMCTVFLAFDVFFVLFCLALACVIGIAVCCCLPCIIAILYAVADQEGASEEVIRALPKYIFRENVANSTSLAQDKCNGHESRGGIMALVRSNSKEQQTVEQQLPPDNAECCICLSSYDDGDELRELPCLHHFHCNCIDKWLRTKPTCPLCKYDIVQGREAGEDESHESIAMLDETDNRV